MEKHRDWITRQLEKSEAAQLSPREVEILKKEAKSYIPLRTEELARIHGKAYHGLRITSAKTRWGSCSSKKNLNFSYRLMRCPKEVIDYVIIHELAHLKHMNHSRSFWLEVGQMMPDYVQQRKWLKKNGNCY
ncbi:MAG: M48 family metallopeptidase [Candidatus Peribacteria bacterium]|nr:MAG: M48 family metallopeptidase [Candidatus Peribacteria bacterium]